jgi:hypothetical protein
MKLIREVTESTNLIVENKLGKGKEYFIEGIFLQSELKNRNGRMYPESVMDNEVARYIKESVDNNRAYGELGHPDTPSINLDRVSHMIVSLKKEGTNYIGKAKILETPMGMIARGLLDGGANLGVSSRALGSLKQNNEGVQVVQDDFMLSTAADIVADPSGPNCFVQGIMENVEWIYEANSKSWIVAENIKKDIKNKTAKQVLEAQAIYFKRFLDSIK